MKPCQGAKLKKNTLGNFLVIFVIFSLVTGLARLNFAVQNFGG